MDRMVELEARFPNTSFVDLHCGAEVTSIVLELAGRNSLDPEEVQLLLETDMETGSTTFLHIKELIESQGLHTLPLTVELSQLDKMFDSFVGIAYTTKSAEQEASGSGNAEAASHYVVLTKREDRYCVADAPDLNCYAVHESGDLTRLSDEIGYNNVVLIVSDEVIEAPILHRADIIFGSVFFAVLVGLLARRLLKSKFRRPMPTPV